VFNWFKKKKAPELEFIPLIEKLLNLQVASKNTNIRRLFSTFMTNKQASGYIFGFHDSMLQSIGLYNANNPENAAYLIEASYKNLFGSQAGYALFNTSLANQNDSDFEKGVMHGGEDMYEYFNNQVPATGLSLILLYHRNA